MPTVVVARLHGYLNRKSRSFPRFFGSNSNESMKTSTAVSRVVRSQTVDTGGAEQDGRRNSSAASLYFSRCESARVLIPKMEDHRERVRSFKGAKPKVDLNINMTPEERAHVASYYATERIRVAKQGADERRNSNRKGPSKLKHKSLKDISGMVETRIQEAVWDGSFKDLKGKGRPLENLGEDITTRLLKQHNCRPVWIDQMHELKEERSQMLLELKGIHHLMQQEEKAFGGVEWDGSGLALKDLHQRAEVYNKKCADWNLTRPLHHLWLEPMKLMQELDRIGKEPQHVTNEYSQFAHLAIMGMRKAKDKRESEASSRSKTTNQADIFQSALWKVFSDSSDSDPESQSSQLTVRGEASAHAKTAKNSGKSERSLVLLAAAPGITCMLGCTALILERGLLY
mmetsp:Transcript_16498/g.23071  ORF Transcript_16498/g.23071 Transcript_16498/m.23071 type:complete len:400 (+) Transcript_16498:134-1333(+)